MEHGTSNSYFLILEDITQTLKSKVKFSRVVRVCEFEKVKRERGLSQMKVAELREIAKKLENIDGGIRPSRNQYRAIITLSGNLTDFSSGTSVQLSKSKLTYILSHFTSSRSRLSHKAHSMVPSLTPNLKSCVSSKCRVRLPLINRLKKRC